jgi:hypothetical protein
MNTNQRGVVSGFWLLVAGASQRGAFTSNQQPATSNLLAFIRVHSCQFVD